MSLFRNKKTYDFRTDFMPGGNAFRHLDRIIKPDIVQAREPKMNEDGTSVVFLPFPDFSDASYKTNNVVFEDRVDESDTRAYGPWLFVAPGVRYFGKNPVSLLFDNPDDSGFIPTEHHPVYLVYETIYRAVRNKTVVDTPFGSSESDKWYELVNGGTSGGKTTYGCISKPGLLGLAYALVYQCGKDQLSPDGIPVGGSQGDRPVVFVMTGTILNTLMGAFDRYLEQANGPANLTGDLGVHFFDRKKGTCRAKATAVSYQAPQLGGRRQAPVGAQAAPAALAGYDVHLTPGQMFGVKLDRDTCAGHACQTLRPWEEVLRGNTPEECAQILATQSGLPMSLLWSAWRSQPQFHTEEMKAGARNPVSQNFGGRRAQTPQEQMFAGEDAAADAAGYQGTTTTRPAPGNPFARPVTQPKPVANDGFAADGPPGNAMPADDTGFVDDEDYGVDPKKAAEAERIFRERYGAQLGGSAVARSNAGQPKPKV